MEKMSKAIRSPVRQLNAERYLMITMLSFAGSISLTRMFLEITGYPQIGNSQLHIAHVLWGGLLLFIAALMPLIYVNHWVLDISALLSGLGVGLFIDEVGKFITESNDYFFPAAAPIIYIVFLLVLLVYTLIRKPRKPDVRSELYVVLQEMQEVLDRDLSDIEHKVMLNRLEHLRLAGDYKELDQLVEKLIQFLNSRNLYIVSHKPDVFVKIIKSWRNFEKKKLSRDIFRRWLISGLALWGVWAFCYPLASWVFSVQQLSLPQIINELINSHLDTSFGILSLMGFRVAGEMVVGVILMIAVFLFIIKKERLASNLTYISLLFSLCGVYILVFYYDQFSTVFYALFQFLLLISNLRYRKCFLLDK